MDVCISLFRCARVPGGLAELQRKVRSFIARPLCNCLTSMLNSQGVKLGKREGIVKSDANHNPRRTFCQSGHFSTAPGKISKRKLCDSEPAPPICLNNSLMSGTRESPKWTQQALICRSCRSPLPVQSNSKLPRQLRWRAKRTTSSPMPWPKNLPALLDSRSYQPQRRIAPPKNWSTWSGTMASKAQSSMGTTTDVISTTSFSGRFLHKLSCSTSPFISIQLLLPRL